MVCTVSHPGTMLYTLISILVQPTSHSLLFQLTQPKFTLLLHYRPPPTILYPTPPHTPQPPSQPKRQCVWDVIQLSMVPNISVMGTYWPIMSLLSCPLLVQRHLTSCWYHIKIVLKDIVIIKLVHTRFVYFCQSYGWFLSERKAFIT